MTVYLGEIGHEGTQCTDWLPIRDFTCSLLGVCLDDKVLGHNFTIPSLDAELENQSATGLINCSRPEYVSDLNYLRAICDNYKKLPSCLK
jgi:hypothetical protein